MRWLWEVEYVFKFIQNYYLALKIQLNHLEFSFPICVVTLRSCKIFYIVPLQNYKAISQLLKTDLFDNRQKIRNSIMTMINSTSSSFHLFHYNLIALYVSEILRDITSSLLLVISAFTIVAWLRDISSSSKTMKKVTKKIEEKSRVNERQSGELEHCGRV